MESDLLAGAEDVVRWMRKKGVLRYERGDLRIILGPEPLAPQEEPREMSDEEQVAAAHRAKKAKYEREFGRPVDDDELRRLP